MLLGDLAKSAEIVKAGVDEEHVDPTCLRLYSLVNATNVGEVGGVPLNRGDLAFDRCDGLIQLGLPTTGDKNSRALLGETLGRAQTDARAAASYDCYFVFKSPVHKS